MPTPVRPAAAALFLVAALHHAGAAQDAVFRSGVDLVTVDATVVGADGRPLTRLEPADFVLKVDGQVRRLVSAEFVDVTAPATRATPLAASHFTSNEQVNQGRLVVVAVDQMHIRRLEGRPSITAAGAFLDTLDPNDTVAVTSLSRVDRLAFTRDRPALKRQLAGMSGQNDPVFLQFNIGLAEAAEISDGGRARLAEVVLRECGRSLTEYINPNRASDDAIGGRDACPEQVEQESRALAQHARTLARISVDALQALIAGLKTLDGPKTIVLLSEGLVLDPRLVDVAELAAAAHDARVAIHALHLEVPIFEAAQDRVSPTLLRDIEIRSDGLARLAGATRGTVQRLVGSDPLPFRRIADELSAYYLLAFEAQEGDRDGRIHRIDLSLARGRARLRARPAFRLPVVRPSTASRHDELVGLLRRTDPATELPVRVATYSYPEPASDKLRVVVSAEAEGRDSMGPVLMGYVLTDARGVIVASGAHQAAEGRHAFSTVVAQGAYMLRVAGIDPLGRRGRVERPFAAAVEERDGLRASDLIVATVPPAANVALHPIVDRVTDRRIVVYLEVHALPEFLRDARIGVEIVNDGDGAIRLTAPARLITQNESWGIARVDVSLAGLGPGRYVARARIQAATSEAPVRVLERPFTYDP